MKRERRILVQGDLLNPDPNAQPPPELIAAYGTYAQMLGPIFRKDKLIAWISVHENTGARHWEDREIEALRQAVQCSNDTIDTVVKNYTPITAVAFK